MELWQYIAYPDKKTNICVDCKNACGGCSWSEIDPETQKPRFAPVEGWTATPTYLNVGMKYGLPKWVETYQIEKCPLFEKG